MNEEVECKKQPSPRTPLRCLRNTTRSLWETLPLPVQQRVVSTLSGAVARHLANTRRCFDESACTDEKSVVCLRQDYLA